MRNINFFTVYSCTFTTYFKTCFKNTQMWLVNVLSNRLVWSSPKKVQYWKKLNRMIEPHLMDQNWPITETNSLLIISDTPDYKYLVKYLTNNLNSFTVTLRVIIVQVGKISVTCSRTFQDYFNLEVLLCHYFDIFLKYSRKATEDNLFSFISYRCMCTRIISIISVMIICWVVQHSNLHSQERSTKYSMVCQTGSIKVLLIRMSMKCTLIMYKWLVPSFEIEI